MKKKIKTILFKVFSYFFFLLFLLNGTLGLAHAEGSLSANWSGYEASNGYYTAINGSWTIPTVSGTAPSGEAAWIGIGGVKSTDLIQTGTLAIIDASHQGQTQYYAWYELLPESAIIIPLSVRPGDIISASIVEQSLDTWLISMNNMTTEKKFTRTVHYVSSHSSVEWIEETPSITQDSVNGLMQLGSFNTVSFSNARAVNNGRVLSLAENYAESITMLSSDGNALVLPSLIGIDNQSFTANRTTATSYSNFSISANNAFRSSSFNPGGRRFRSETKVMRILFNK